MPLSNDSWIDTSTGLVHMSHVCEFFMAKIAKEEEEAPAKEDSDSDDETDNTDEEDATPAPTHGVWVTSVSGDTSIVYQGSEADAQTLIDELRKSNNSIDLEHMIPVRT